MYILHIYNGFVFYAFYTRQYMSTTLASFLFDTFKWSINCFQGINGLNAELYCGQPCFLFLMAHSAYDLDKTRPFLSSLPIHVICIGRLITS